jgi:hypothetical protein
MNLMRAQMQKMKAESQVLAQATDGQLKSARAELQQAMKMLDEERAELLHSRNQRAIAERNKLRAEALKKQLQKKHS